MWQNKGTNNYVDANIRYKHFFNIVSRISSVYQTKHSDKIPDSLFVKTL